MSGVADIEHTWDFAATVGGWLAVARMHGVMTEEGMRALAKVDALADAAADADPVLSRWARAKWQAVLHGDDVIEGTATDAPSWVLEEQASDG